MHTEKQDDPLADMGYERQDISIRGIRTASIWFFGFTIFCIVASLAVFRLMNPKAFASTNDQRPFSQRVPEPPNPLLQSNVTKLTDMYELRAKERQVLSTTAWVDREKGVVRIPIDRAIELVAQRGIPQTGRAVPAVTRGQQDRAGGETP